MILFQRNQNLHFMQILSVEDLFCGNNKKKYFNISSAEYSITSMARTRMARLPWMIRTFFSVPTKSFQ